MEDVLSAPQLQPSDAATSQLLCLPQPQQQASRTPQRLEDLESHCWNSRQRDAATPYVCQLPLPQQLASATPQCQDRRYLNSQHQGRRNVRTEDECRCRNKLARMTPQRRRGRGEPKSQNIEEPVTMHMMKDASRCTESVGGTEKATAG